MQRTEPGFSLPEKWSSGKLRSEEFAMPSQNRIQQIQTLLKETEGSFPHEDCYTCECFLGYVTQLELDTDEPLQPLLSAYKPDKRLIHSCLGCDPCPPADAYANYLQARNLIDPKDIFG